MKFVNTQIIERKFDYIILNLTNPTSGSFNLFHISSVDLQQFLEIFSHKNSFSYSKRFYFF